MAECQTSLATSSCGRIPAQRPGTGLWPRPMLHEPRQWGRVISGEGSMICRRGAAVARNERRTTSWMWRGKKDGHIDASGEARGVTEGGGRELY